MKKLLLAVKTLTVVVCLYVALSGMYPPGMAQGLVVQPVPVITTEDALQDDRIKTMQDQVSKQFVRMNSVEAAIAGMQAEERVIGAVIGILTSAGLILQVKKGKGA